MANTTCPHARPTSDRHPYHMRVTAKTQPSPEVTYPPAFIHLPWMEHLKVLGNLLGTGDRTADQEPVYELTLQSGRPTLRQQKEVIEGKLKSIQRTEKPPS